MPESAYRLHILCQVVTVGDGVVGKETKLMWPMVGDNVFVQMSPALTKSLAQRIYDNPLFVIHQNDCIARITGRDVTLENFHPIGRWLLASVEYQEESGGIFLPNSNQMIGHAGSVRFFMHEQGAAANIDAKAGDELYLDKTRANPISFAGKKFVYIDRDSVVATLHGGGRAE